MEKINAKPEPKLESPPEPSMELLNLMSKVDNRRWLAEEIPATEERLKKQLYDLKFVIHAPKCEQCMAELQIDVERYGGSRSGLWFLDLTNEVGIGDDEEFWETMPEYFKSMPRVNDYRIGSYWNGASEDTVRFIKDRLEWARKNIVKEVRTISNYLRALKNWDLKSELPPNSFFWGVNN